MENTQPSTNLNFTEKTAQQAGGLYNSRLLVVVVISVLLTALTTGLVVYFWQKSTNEKMTNSLNQGVASLEEQILKMGREETVKQPTLPQSLSPTPTIDASTDWKIYTSQDKKYTLKYPSDWTFHDESRYIDLYQDGNTQFQHEVSISKDKHIFKSRNPLAWSPSECLYPDSSDFVGHFQQFNDFTEIRSTVATYRRPKNPIFDSNLDVSRWTICQAEASGFTTHAGFGSIHYESPSNYNKDLIEIMDQILSTFKFLDSNPTDETAQGNNLGEIREASLDYLKTTGIDLNKQEIKKIESFGGYNSIYIVSYGSIESEPIGGSYFLIGKQNNKWIFAKNYDENYCKWVKESNVDEATRAFMGVIDNCK